jgi:KaiC/GvpD/RAD55 family RecA-like ATPase
MNHNTDHEKLFYVYSLEKPKYLEAIDSSFYSTNELRILSKLSRAFYKRFSRVPTPENIKLLLNKKSADIKDSHVDLIFKENLKNYDPEWLDTTLQAWIQWNYMETSLIDAVEYVKTSKVTPDNVQQIVNRVKEIFIDRNSLRFDDDLGLDFFQADHHEQHIDEKMSSNLDFVDTMTNGGYDPASLIVYAGEQNIGKSIWLANDAANFVQRGHNTAFITAEMQAHKVIKRIGANLLNVSLAEYEKHSTNKEWVKKKLQSFGGLIPPGSLQIKKFPTSMATVHDIENYVHELENVRGIKIRVVVIDYINILCNYRNPNSENTYMKIKQLAEDLRAMADRNGWLVITATQIKRGNSNVSDFNMDDIAESAGLAHTADMIYGIIQDESMYANREYWLKALKVRDGEGKGTKCRFEIAYEYMRLTETSDIRDGNSSVYVQQSK